MNKFLIGFFDREDTAPSGLLFVAAFRKRTGRNFCAPMPLERFLVGCTRGVPAGRFWPRPTLPMEVHDGNHCPVPC